MDKEEGNSSYPSISHESSNSQNDLFDEDVDKKDYVYSTESSEDDNVVGRVDGDDDDNDVVQDVGLDRIEEKKKRKLENLLSRYELAPRALVTPHVSKPTRAGRNSLTDWTEQESFTLLEAWGERYLKHSRKNVRSEEWHEVAQKVSEGPKIKRTETQCRNRLDTLKKKYKKEKVMLAENVGATSQWVYFSKMDTILNPSLNQESGYVAVVPKPEPKHDLNQENGYVTVEPKVDPKHDFDQENGYVSVELKADPRHDFDQANEYVLVEPKVVPKHDFDQGHGYVLVEPKVDPNHDPSQANGYVLVEPKVDPNHDLNQANSSNAGSSEETKNDSHIGNSKFYAKDASNNVEDCRRKNKRACRDAGEGDSFKMLADSIYKLADTYEKVNSEKSKQLIELEKIRVEMRRDAELEKSKILKKAHVEIAKIWGLTSKDLEPSPGNISG